jgi:hypothetical protein
MIVKLDETPAEANTQSCVLSDNFLALGLLNGLYLIVHL